MLTFRHDTDRQKKAPEPLTFAEDQQVIRTLNTLIGHDEFWTDDESRLLQALLDNYQYLKGKDTIGVYLRSCNSTVRKFVAKSTRRRRSI